MMEENDGLRLEKRKGLLATISETEVAEGRHVINRKPEDYSISVSDSDDVFTDNEPVRERIDNIPDDSTTTCTDHYDTRESPSPNLCDECVEMCEFASMMFFLSKMRNLARDNELFKDSSINTWGKRSLSINRNISSNNVNEDNFDGEIRIKTEQEQHCILKEYVKLSDIVDTMQSCHEAITEVEGKLPNGNDRVNLHINIVEEMLARGGDDAYQIACFDDLEEDEEIVPAIIIDNYREQVIVAFRGSQSTNDWKVNFTATQSMVKNPVYAMKNEKEAITEFLNKESDVPKRLLMKQPRKMRMHKGFYNAIFDESSKAGMGSKYDYIMKKILAVLKDHQGYRLISTGSSLGGALCQVFAIHAAAETNPLIVKPVKCYSFASPKVGTLSYRRAVQVSGICILCIYLRYNHM